MLKSSLIIAIILSAFGVLGQTGSLSGTVQSSEGKNAEFAEVRLCNAVDTTVIQGATTDELGTFLIPDIQTGTYLIKVSLDDHLPNFIPSITISPDSNFDLGIIKLELDKALNLEEVIASGSLDDLKAGIDKKVYTVDQDISTRGGTATDVLNNIPSIDVDKDGNVSLRGDGNVTILIDGRPSALTAGNGKNLLEGLPANSIERIEVVTNPSAKYDPDGTSGIINIVLKKNRRRGANGAVSATAATGHMYDASVALSYRSTKWNVYLNYSFNYYEGFRNNYNSLYQEFGTDSVNYLDQDREGTDLKSNHTLIFGTDYEINDRNSLGFSLTGSKGRREREGNLESSLFDQNDVLFRRWDRMSFDPIQSLNADVNLNYIHKFKDGKGNWITNANQSIGDVNTEGFYEEIYYNNDGTLSGAANLNQYLSNASQVRITTVQSDVEYILKKINARIETGGKAIIQKEDVDTYSERQDTLTGIYVPDTLANFIYSYDEQIYSLYGIFGQQFGKFSYQAGLRGEFAIQTPNLVSSNLEYRNTYFNLFPSAHVKYKPTKKDEVSLSYSRRINRASSGQLNPFTSYANPLDLERGNPELQPEYINSYDAGYSLTTPKVVFSVSAYHRRTTDVINRIRVYFPNNTSMMTYANIDKSASTGLETILIYRPTKWMKNTFSFNGNYINYTNADTTVDWSNDGINWGLKYAVNVDFWKGTAAFQINAQYRSPWVSPQGRAQRRTGIDVSVEKRFFDNHLTIGARVTDVFDRMGFHLELEQPGIRQEADFKWLTRRFYITASYRFGKQDMKQKPTRGSGGGGDEM